MTRKLWGLAAGFGLLATLPIWGGVVYVAPGGAATEPYDSWQTAANDIQTAINYASDGDTLLITAGVYQVATTIRVDRDLTLRGVSEGRPPTVDGGGLVRCLRATAGTTVHLDNLSFINGLGDAKDQNGAGVSMFDGSVTDCVFSNNTHTYYGLKGGGLYVKGEAVIERSLFIHNESSGGGGMCSEESAALQIIDCTFSENSSRSGGGLELIDMVNVLVDKSRFISNTSSGNGGGFYGTSAGAGENLIKNCLFTGNIAGTSSGIGGGGLRVNGDSYIVTDCVITNNTAGNYGGGLYVSGANIYNSLIAFNRQWPGDNNQLFGGGGAVLSGGALINCRIEGNLASSSGGGVLGSSATIRNCLIINNERRDGVGSFGGGGIRVRSGTGMTVENCTIAGNYADQPGGGLHLTVPITLINTIVYDNLSKNYPNYGNIYYRDSGGDTVTINSCFTPVQTAANQSLWTNNIHLDPLFAEGYRLAPKSPCVNTGFLLPWMEGARDLAGKRRVDAMSGKVDMGCFEHIPAGVVVLVR